VSPSAIAHVLGGEFARLPVEVRTAHGGGTLLLTGRANADVGRGWVTAMIRGLFGFPRPGRDMPVTIAFATDESGRDSWRRDFDGRKYSSTMEAGSGRHAGLLVERQQLFTWVFRLSVDDQGRLILQLVASRVLGIPQPRWLAPRCFAVETGAAGKFTFDITVDLPIFGRLIRYWGTMDIALEIASPLEGEVGNAQR
jgi:hypothetical protein